VPPQAKLGKPKRSWLGWAARLMLCMSILAWILHAIFSFEAMRLAGEDTWQTMPRADRWNLAWTAGPRSLFATIAAIHPGAFALSLFVMGCILLIGVARWRMVLRVHGLHLGWRRSIEISLVAHFFNSFLLGSAGGDVIRALYAARETHHKKTEAVITVFMDRILGLWSLLLFGCFLMLPNLGLIQSHPLLKLCCAVVATMTLAATLLLTLALKGGLGSRFRYLRELVSRLPNAASIERSLRACRRFGREPGTLLKVMGISMVLNLLCVVHVQVIANGLPRFVLDPQLTALLVPVITAIIALPITLNGIGMRELLFVKLLHGGPLTMDPHSAMTLSLLAYGGSLFWSLVGGVMYLTARRTLRLEPDMNQGTQ